MTRWWPLTLRGTGAAVLAVACFVLAHEIGLVELVYFGVLLSALLVAGIATLWLSRRTEAVTRTLTPDVAAVGRRTDVRVRVAVRSALPAPPGRWHDALSPGLVGRAGGVFPALGSGLRGGAGDIELRYQVEGAGRGIHSLGPLAVTATDPFGLTRRHHRLGAATRVVVAPAVVDLQPLTAAPGEAGGMLQTAAAQPGQGSDNLIARPYAPGDSMRRIHWRASAHRDELMVRQEEQEASPEATVVLDRGERRWSPGATTAPGADPAFETAVSMCVSAVSRLVREGYAVDVVDSDGASLADAITAGETAEVEVLAARFATLTARAGDGLGRVTSLFAGTLTGPVVVVTGRIEPADVEALAPLAHHSALPVLLAVGPSEEQVDRLRAFGWHTAALAADDDLGAAWTRAAERGPVDVG
jgi:uncharacterized protein (DUF58 family)